METKKNRILLRPRAAKKRGNPIFISSQTIPDREPVPIIILEPEALTRVNEVIASEQSYSSAECLTTLPNKRSNIPKEDISELTEPDTHRPQLKRQRMNDDVLRDKCEEHESFVMSLPLSAFEKRLDYSSRCADNKCRPGTMALTGEIHPKEISLSAVNHSPEGGSGRYGGMLMFKALDTVFDNKWGFGNGPKKDFPEVDKAAEGSKEVQLRAEESSDIIENVDDGKRAREKRVCESVFELVRLMELRRVGLVKPPKNPSKHIQLIEEIRKCTANLCNKSFSNNCISTQTHPVFEISPVVNQETSTVKDFEPIPVEDSCSTVEHDEQVSSVDYSHTANITSPAREDNEDDVSHERPILKRRKKQLNSWKDIHEESKDDKKGASFKDRLNPIAAAEYEEMEVVELDVYDELPNQFRSDMPKEFTRRWSTQDTEEFYKCIALLGLDFGRIATVMKRTQKQITNKYKTEQKNNNQRLHNALIRQEEFFEYRKKYRF
ncbi:hypothetical protein C1645_836348 [Glomus cerebriforme]|uniref:SANT domain-containing protein n=1 Tax=Glomus cerebriforme TaxID=658196 RepID=A0A397S8L1_9GLOM|nr:hypothetical protein C1645_836348 [Glomus cerebriforme]